MSKLRAIYQGDHPLTLSRMERAFVWADIFEDDREMTAELGELLPRL